MAMEQERSSGEQDFCTFAGKNPTCPYVSQIKQQGEDIRMIKKALIGEDMQGGLVKKVNSMQSTWRALQPYILIVATAVVTWVFTHLHW
jgi:hypothetical protein